MIEEFKYYCGKRTIYEVSNLGRVKRNGEIIEPKIINSGYKSCKFLIHRAVAELFIPNPDNKPCVDHIDCNKLNNNVDNLKWSTYSENMMNPITRKHNSESQTWQKGENNPMYGVEKSLEWRENHSKLMRENNPMKGKSPKDFMTEEQILEWRKNISKGKKGSHLSPESLQRRTEKNRIKKLNNNYVSL